MIRLASSPEPNMKLLARSALTMLSAPTLMKASNSRLSEAGDAAFDALRDWARGNGDDVDTRPASSAEVLAALSPERPLEIAIRDWDVLFRAVEARLLQGVGYQLESVPKSPASDAAESVQSIVVECVTALRQLHVALAQEREQRDPSHGVDAQTPGNR